MVILFLAPRSNGYQNKIRIDTETKKISVGNYNVSSIADETVNVKSKADLKVLADVYKRIGYTE